VKVAPGTWKRNTNTHKKHTILTDTKSVRLITVKSPRLIIGGYESRVLINLSNCKENTLSGDCALRLFKELFMFVMRVARAVTDKSETAFAGVFLVKGDGRADYQTLILVLMACNMQFIQARISDNKQ
jgi:hypothetical protein